MRANFNISETGKEDVSRKLSTEMAILEITILRVLQGPVYVKGN